SASIITSAQVIPAAYSLTVPSGNVTLIIAKPAPPMPLGSYCPSSISRKETNLSQDFINPRFGKWKIMSQFVKQTPTSIEE
ncbi:MAG TPA: hypothetical protein HA327_05570, partial [Candidatus Poseidoniaceae archaeon]|nr:hypothetical protein [Candidatus Poseidoniaceae archaeon]